MIDRGFNKLFEETLEGKEPILDDEEFYKPFIDAVYDKYKDEKSRPTSKNIVLEYDDLGAECERSILTNGGNDYRHEYADDPEYDVYEWVCDYWNYVCSLDEWWEVLSEYLHGKYGDFDLTEQNKTDFFGAFKTGEFYEYLLKRFKEAAEEDAQENCPIPEEDFPEAEYGIE